MTRLDWSAILTHAAPIVTEYPHGVTLRRLFYRLVSDGTLPNTQTAYKTLSKRTAAARRDGSFPDLVDNTRTVHEAATFADPEDARQWLASIYRVDRTEGQEHAVFLGVEKDGYTSLLSAWFGRYGVPIVVLRGYTSQTYADDIAARVAEDGRPAVLLYAGDFDPSGLDIERDAVARTACWEHVERVALDWSQVERYDLPPKVGKATDSRAAAFVARHGALVQVELDALPDDVLRQAYADALAPYWDTSAFDAALARERAERESLRPDAA